MESLEMVGSRYWIASIQIDVEEKTMHFYIFEVAKFFKTNVYNFPTSFHHLYLAKRAARHGTALARLGTGTVGHGGTPCRAS
jgi:hypothetical protein